MMQNRFYHIVLTALFLVAFGSPVSAAETTVARGQITGGVEHAAPDWFKESFLDIAEDAGEAADADKHLILFFQLNGCPYCDRMLSEIFQSDPHKSYIQEHFDVIAINVRGDREIAFNEELSVKEKELAEELRVFATPGILFLNAENKTVARVDGYRAPERFAHILRYVSSKSYQSQKLSEYLAQNADKSVYTLKDSDLFTATTDLSAINGPLAVIFEDGACYDCDEFHERLLSGPEVIKELEQFTVVRLDTGSDAPIIGVDGQETTAKSLADSLEMTYRPGVVMYADGVLLRRYDSLLNRHHFKEGFRWISSGAYKNEDYRTYSERRTEELLSAGENIDLAE